MKAVYFMCLDRNWGYIATDVWDILSDEGYFQEDAGFTFCGQPVMKYSDGNNQFYFAGTDKALYLDYPRYLPEMNRYFSDFDMSGMITWHEGANAPDHVLTVHSLGDMASGCYGKARPRYMRNLIRAYDRNRLELGLDNYHVVTEATHWSGCYDGHGDPNLLIQFPVPMVDIEVGSDPSCWTDRTAARALARTLTHAFDDDGAIVHNILCMGGIHFDPNFAEAALHTWGNEAYGVTHILANQWLVSGAYEDESGFTRACAAVDSIEGGIEAIFFHDKLKGCYKDLVRKLGAHYNVPIYKHQKLREPETIEWKL